jgi:cytochrome c
MIGRVLLALAFTFITLTAAAAASPQEQRGRTFALNNCAKCHSIDKVSVSPLKIAPPFRTLHKRYPIETIGEALAEGIYTGPSSSTRTRSAICWRISRRSNNRAGEFARPSRGQEA